MAFCNGCGKQLDEGVKFCKSCGTKQDNRDPSLSHNSSIKSQDKTQSKVMLLAIIPGLLGVCGCGHIYTGKVTRGIIFLFAGWLILTTTLFTFGLSWVLYVGLYIFQIIDAKKLQNS